MKKRVVLLVGLVVSLFVLIGCGSSEKKQSEEIIKAVFSYNKNETKGSSRFKENETNYIIYDDSNKFYVVLIKGGQDDDGLHHTYDSIYEVNKHKEFSVSQTDIERVFYDEVKAGMDIFYEKVNLELKDDFN